MPENVSKNHLGFAGDFEFYKRGLSVYKAKISSGFIDGYREINSWVCPTYLWKNYQWTMDGQAGIDGIYLHAEIAAQQSVQADLAIVCEKCGSLAKYPVCECGNPIPRPPNR